MTNYVQLFSIHNYGSDWSVCGQETCHWLFLTTKAVMGTI